MVVRAFRNEDAEELVRIHEKHFSHEFDIDNFTNLVESAFVIEKHDKIVCIGGLRPLAEAVLVTDMDENQITRTKALREALNIFGYIARRTGHDSIHAFVKDDQWRNHLVNEGFVNCIGTALYLKV